MSNFLPATHESSKLEGFNQPRVWTIMNELATKTRSINLGQGFPTWDPPQFFRDYLQESVATSNHQYVRAFGSLNYLQSIKKFHGDTFHDLDVEKNIVTTFGGSEALYCCIMGLVNEGEEVIIFDPAYDVYRPQTQMAGGKAIGIQLRPKKHHTKAELIERFDRQPVEATEQDEWEVDWNQFEAALNQKTKIVIITTPHNPVGKVFTYQQLDRIAQILKKYPQVVIIEDNVYEGMTYDNLFGHPLPKIVKHKELLDRTLSIYSGGKIFAATGVRCGWIIGPEHLIRSARSVHQYSVFCQYNPIENGLSKSLDHISAPNNTYLLDFARDMIAKRNLLVKLLLKSSYDFDLWVPKGSHFILADISRIQVKEKYAIDDNGNKRSKDYAFAYQLAHENGVVCIPCSPLYDKDNVTEGEKYVRFAFCKGDAELLQAGERLARKVQ